MVQAPFVSEAVNTYIPGVTKTPVFIDASVWVDVTGADVQVIVGWEIVFKPAFATPIFITLEAEETVQSEARLLSAATVLRNPATLPVKVPLQSAVVTPDAARKA